MHGKVDHSTNGSPRLVVIGIDGVDQSTLDHHRNAGWLPEIQKLVDRARSVAFENQGDLFITSPWVSMASGVSVENHGQHAFSTDPQRNSGNRQSNRSCCADSLLGNSCPGRTEGVCARFSDLCSPIDRCGTSRSGICRVGAASPDSPCGSYPPSLIQPIIQKYGHHPCTADDLSLTSARSLVSVRDRICQGVRLRERILTDRIRQGPWIYWWLLFPEAHIAVTSS